MKKILGIVLIVLLFTQNVYAIEPTEDFYVNDYANILNEETEEFIQNNSVNLWQKTKAQIVVITVPNLEGRSLEEYATDTFRKFGIGDKELNNGLLILIALEERKSRIEVGYGLEDILPDGKTGRIQDDYMIPYFKDNNFDEGILNGYKALYEEVAKKYDLETDITPVKVNNIDEEESPLLSLAALLLIGKSIYTIMLYYIDLDSKETKKKNFIILEILTVLIGLGSLAGTKDLNALWLIVAGTFINLGAISTCLSGGIGSGGYSGGGGYHGGYHSSSHSHHSGGGGRSGGGGSSRGF